MLLKALAVILPWRLKRFVLNRFFKYSIDPSASIGLAWVFPKQLIMEPNTRIDHLNVAINLDKIHMKESSSISRGNWITGFPTQTSSLHFQHQPDRRAELILGESASITKNHHIDCTNSITIGAFSTVAGYYSQLLTHSINVFTNQQDSAPIHIGEYTFIGTNVVILGGSVLPDHSVLSAKSLLNKPYTEGWTMYGGVPAKPIRNVPQEAAYFSRTDGFVR